MTCDGLSLSTTVPELTLSSEGNDLTLEGGGAPLTLSNDECMLTLAVESRLAFEVSTTELSLETTPTELCFSSPVPVGSGEANTASNCGTGAGVYRDQQGVNLRFRSLRSLADGLKVEENDTDCTVDFDLSEGFFANCSEADAVGELVYVSGATLGVLDVAPVDIADPAKMPARGTIESKQSGTVCFVRTHGVSGGFAGLAEGQRYFAGNGAPSASPPASAGEIVQLVGVAVSETELYLDLSGQLMRRA